MTIPLPLRPTKLTHSFYWAPYLSHHTLFIISKPSKGKRLPHFTSEPSRWAGGAVAMETSIGSNSRPPNHLPTHSLAAHQLHRQTFPCHYLTSKETYCGAGGIFPRTSLIIAERVRKRASKGAGLFLVWKFN